MHCTIGLFDESTERIIFLKLELKIPTRHVTFKLDKRPKNVYHFTRIEGLTYMKIVLELMP